MLGRAWGGVVLTQPQWWAGSLGGDGEGGAAEMCKEDYRGGLRRFYAS